MTLHGWQTTLSSLVIAQAAGVELPAIDRTHSLSAAERRWLTGLATTPGFGVTCNVQRWWREFRVQMAAPLTLSLLDVSRRREVIAAFLLQTPKASSFFVREALPFLDLVAQQAADVPHLTELAAFERAMLLLGQALASNQVVDPGDLNPSTDQIEVHALAALIPFRAPPEQVLVAAMQSLPLPPVGDHVHWLLVAPGIPNLARSCSAAEASLFEALRKSPSTVAALGDGPHAAATLQALWQAGALTHRA